MIGLTRGPTTNNRACSAFTVESANASWTKQPHCSDHQSGQIADEGTGSSKMKIANKSRSAESAAVILRAATPAVAEIKKSDATRLRILDAAAFVLSHKGYSGTKLSDIAKRADLQISTLYYYFTSREDLVLEVLLRGNTQVMTHVESVVSKLHSDLSPVERVCAAAEAHLRCILEISDYTEATVRNAGQLPKQLQVQHAKEQAKYGRFWQQLIDAGVSGQGYAGPKRRRALRLLIIGALNWTVEWWNPSLATVDEVVETAMTMTRRALTDK
jgi:AcrR family transcriptional regulator